MGETSPFVSAGSAANLRPETGWDWTAPAASAFLPAVNVRIPLAVGVAVCLLAGSTAIGAPARTKGVSVSVTTAPGATDSVRAALRARGFRVDRRVGGRLQVVIRRSAQRRAIESLPGVADVVLPPSAYGDIVVSQGVDRTGASALTDVAGDGVGLRIAILDLGFGLQVAPLQAAGELPPPERLIQQSFDPAAGIAGTNAYGSLTDHGQLVAQTVYDYAPRATYLFVNYHTPDDFVAAVDWLTTQRVDVVVHSNNFLEGPFDGTSPAARAVDRAAAAGVMWFNSAGNYGEKHWSGPWTDNDGDRVLDWPGTTPWLLTRLDNQALTFHLSWLAPPGAAVSDIDLVLERRLDDGTWLAVAASTDKQLDGAAPAERINGVRPGTPSTYRLRAVLVSGPPPAGPLTLYSREDDLLPVFGGAGRGSVPTPADAAGSISVGAIDWRGNSLARYSSRGPTADGRFKPEISAPTGTRLATPIGDERDVGGTSIAAPNAAGAAAIALGALRRSGLRPTVGEMRTFLTRDALDLGTPGPDLDFGAGRLRVDVEAPTLRTVVGPSVRPVRSTGRVAIEATDAGQVVTWSLLIDGVRKRSGRAGTEVLDLRFGTRNLPDGPHTVAVEVGDAVGNLGRRTWRVTTDNTPPTLAVNQVLVRPALVTSVGGRKRRQFPVGLTVTSGDTISRNLTVDVSLTKLPRGPVRARSVRVAGGVARGIGLGTVPTGAYLLRVAAADAAGNRQVLAQRISVRAPGLASPARITQN